MDPALTFPRFGHVALAAAGRSFNLGDSESYVTRPHMYTAEKHQHMYRCRLQTCHMCLKKDIAAIKDVPKSHPRLCSWVVKVADCFVSLYDLGIFV